MGKKLGEGHAEAWVRAGFKEAAANLLPAFPQQQRLFEEQGLVGNPTPGEVARERDHREEQQTSVLGYPLEQPPPEQGRGNDRGRGR